MKNILSDPIFVTFAAFSLPTSIFEPLLGQIWKNSKWCICDFCSVFFANIYIWATLEPIMKNILSDPFLWLLHRFLCQHLYLSHSWTTYEKNIQSDPFFVTFAAFSLPTSIFEPLLNQIWKKHSKWSIFCDFCSVFFANIYIWATLEPNMKKHSKWSIFCDFCSVFFANIYIWATLEPNMKKNILSDPFFVTFAAFSLPTSIFEPLLSQIWKNSKWCICDFCSVFFANIYIWATLEPNMKNILSDPFLWLLQRFLCQHLYLSHSWTKYEKNIQCDPFLWLLQRFLCQHLYLSPSWTKYGKNIQSDPFFVTFAAFSLPTSTYIWATHEPNMKKHSKWFIFCDFCSVFFANIYIWATLEPNMKKTFKVIHFLWLLQRFLCQHLYLSHSWAKYEKNILSDLFQRSLKVPQLNRWNLQNAILSFGPSL